MSTGLNITTIPMSQVPSGRVTNNDARRFVLVVDDERVIADTLSIILSRSGFSVRTAYDGKSALEIALLELPDLLLSDVMMGPGMDGTELAVEVLRAVPDCRILLFSGHAATRDLLDKARDAGHNFTLLNKPLHPADLLARINESFPSARRCATT